MGTSTPRCQCRPKKFQKGRKDNDSYVYAVIDDTWYTWASSAGCQRVLPPGRGGHLPALPGAHGDFPPSTPTNSRAPTELATMSAPLAPLLSLRAIPYTFSHPKDGRSKQEHRHSSAGCPLPAHGARGITGPPKDGIQQGH